MELEKFFQIRILSGPINEALHSMIPDWHSRDAAKRIYRAFNQPNKDELHQLLREARDSDQTTQNELIEKLAHNVDFEEALNELGEATEVRLINVFNGILDPIFRTKKKPTLWKIFEAQSKAKMKLSSKEKAFVPFVHWTR
jgi:hypothetical protein